MSQPPKISVVMTVYNARLFVKEAIKSILTQSFHDFEFIIVDNFSSDSTRELIAAMSDPRMILIKNPENYGQTRALNIGARRARGKYIARMDADDISLPDRLRVQYEYLQRHPEIAVVGSWSIDISEWGRKIRLVKTVIDPLEIKCHLAASGELTSWCIAHPTVMMCSHALADVGYYTENSGDSPGFPQDYDLWNKLVRKGYRFANIPLPLLRYRILPVSESRSFVDKAMTDRLEITRQKIKFYLPGLNEGDGGALSSMLEFLPQMSAEAGKNIFTLFDRFMKSYLGEEFQTAEAQRSIATIKLYYVPRLFYTNKCLSLQEAGKILMRHPVLLFHGRFYRKIIKVLLQSIVSRKTYNSLIKRILFYR